MTDQRDEQSEPSITRAQLETEIGDLRKELLAEIRRHETWVRDRDASLTGVVRDHRSAIEGEFRDHQRYTEKEISGRFHRQSLLGAAAFVLVAGFFWWEIGSSLEKTATDQIEKRLDDEFSTDRIRETVANAASGRAEEIIETRIEPVVGSAEAAVQQASASVKKGTEDLRAFISETKRTYTAELQTLRDEITSAAQTGERDLRTFIDETKETYSEELESLRHELALLKAVNEVRILRARAIEGEAAAYSKLRLAGRDGNEAVAMEVKAAIMDVHNMLYGTRRGHLFPVQHKRRDGTSALDTELNTDELLECLVIHQFWAARGRCASLLVSHREYRVLPTLFEAFRSDENMWVRGEALRALRSLANVTNTISVPVVQLDLRKNDESLREQLGADESTPVAPWMTDMNARYVV